MLRFKIWKKLNSVIPLRNTTDRFRSRWNNHKRDVRKAESSNMENVKQKFLQSHFLQSDHQDFLKDVRFS